MKQAYEQAEDQMKEGREKLEQSADLLQLVTNDLNRCGDDIAQARASY